MKNKAVHFSTHAHFESNQNTGEISSGIKTASEQKFEVARIDSKLNNSNIAETEDGALAFQQSTISSSSESTCPEITDLACQYLGEGIYKLTWSVPKIPIYTENGTLSEYRITRRSLKDNKAYVYKTPEPDCIDGTCTIIFRNLDDSYGYIWSVDTRCTRTTFNTSNKVECRAKTTEIVNTDNENTEQSAETNYYSGDAASDNDPHNKRFNKNAVFGFLLIPLLFLAGIVATVLILEYLLFPAALLLIGIIIGCIFAIKLSRKGKMEIKADRKRQVGLFLAFLGTAGAVIGLLLSGLLLYAVIFEAFF